MPPTLTPCEVTRSPIIEAKRENWRIDPDGMLRVTANVLKQGVFPYALENYGEEIPADVKEIIGDRDTVREFINLDTLTDEVLATLEGKPVIADAHWWQTVDDEDFTEEEREALKKGEAIRIGCIAGKPYRDGEYVRADFLIDHKKAIQRIKERDLSDCSAGYASIILAEPGSHKNEQYDVEQKIKRFNHVAALKPGKGRCGRDVKILNGTDKENTMSVIINRQIGKTVEKFTFNSEDDAREAERMAESISGVIEMKRKNAADEAEKKENENETLKKENEELGQANSGLEAAIAEMNSKLDRLLGLEVKEQQNEEEVILAEEMNESDAEETAKEVEKENSLEGRRNKIVQVVARMNGVDATGWSQDAVDAQFQMLSARARKSKEDKLNAHPVTRTSEITPPEGGFKRQNSGDGGNKAQRAAQKRLNAANGEK